VRRPIGGLVWVAFGVAVFAFTVQSAFANVIVSLDPSSQEVALGSQANVDLDISGLGNPPSLGTFDLNVSFDPTILSFSDIAFGDPVLGDELDPTGLGNTISFSSEGVGTVEVFDLSLDSAATLDALQPSAFTLGVLTFEAIGGGASSLELSVNALGDADGNSLSADLQNASVGVSSVPEPTSSVLLAGAVIAIIMRARRSHGQGCPS
jgi:hypothetical protein